MNISTIAKGTKIAGTFTVTAVESFEDINFHRKPTANTPRERVWSDPGHENPDFRSGVIEFCRMVVLETPNGAVQWFGKPDTKFWRDNFSSKLDTPLQVGAVVSFVGFAKCVKPADEMFRERVVVQRPSIVG